MGDLLPAEPPNLTALFWPDGRPGYPGHLAIRYDADAPTSNPERRWWQPNDTSMRAETWPDLVEWMRVLECPINKAIRFKSRRTT
jgi:hypothetical protein